MENKYNVIGPIYAIINQAIHDAEMTKLDNNNLKVTTDKFIKLNVKDNILKISSKKNNNSSIGTMYFGNFSMYNVNGVTFINGQRQDEKEEQEYDPEYSKEWIIENPVCINEIVILSSGSLTLENLDTYHYGQNLTVATNSSGSVNINDKLQLESLNCTSNSSGYIKIFSFVGKFLELNTKSSGNIQFKEGIMDTLTAYIEYSGDIIFNKIVVKEVAVLKSYSSGGFNFRNGSMKKLELNLDSSGNAYLNIYMDKASLITNSSGNISGFLANEYLTAYSNSSGNINGICLKCCVVQKKASSSGRVEIF